MLNCLNTSKHLLFLSKLFKRHFSKEKDLMLVKKQHWLNDFLLLSSVSNFLLAKTTQQIFLGGWKKISVLIYLIIRLPKTVITPYQTTNTTGENKTRALFFFSFYIWSTGSIWELKTIPVRGKTTPNSFTLGKINMTNHYILLVEPHRQGYIHKASFAS